MRIQTSQGGKVGGSGRSKKRVALFGGSFNPPHIGHTAICKWVLGNRLADEIWIIPCFIHPFRKELASFAHRLKMCQLAFLKYPLPIHVLDVERKLGDVSFTLRTIKHLKKEHPENRYLLITGADVQASSEEWREFDKIKKEVELIEVPRGALSPIPDVSSTEIRRRIDNCESYVELVEKEVAVYIITKGLFR